jgi:hypothetical protein
MTKEKPFELVSLGQRQSRNTSFHAIAVCMKHSGPRPKRRARSGSDGGTRSAYRMPHAHRLRPGLWQGWYACGALVGQ